MIETTLKACPFCGSANVLPAPLMAGINTTTRYIECADCGAQGPSGDNLMEAVRKWNTRPYEAQIQQAIKAAEVDAAARELFNPK